ncbi:MAG: transposase [Peptococcaceae bacterium]|nr:transposase [Peptococcaceae bacterium]
MFGNFEIMTNLQYKVKSLQHELDLFRSGEKYVQMHARFRADLAKKDREIKRLHSDLATAHTETMAVRNRWFQVFDDIQIEHADEISRLERAAKDIEERALRAERRVDELKDENIALRRERYAIASELEEERGKNQKLTVLINQNHENSSLPSSQKPGHKIISNNRERTNKKPGGQPGHVGHGRKKQIPSVRIEIPPPEEYLNNPDYESTGIEKRRQKVSLSVALNVEEYFTLEFRHKKTGKLVHADFPTGVDNDVNYDGSIKAFAFLLNNYCNVSIDKVRNFMSDMTGGALEISKGMINGLSREFSTKSKAEQEKVFLNLVGAPVLNEDFTGARVNGKTVQIICCATPNHVAYFAREHKGHEGVKGTPSELNSNIHVHDHDLTFYNYGKLHQECMIHILRYLVNSIENEKNLTWNTDMRKLIQEMIHYRNSMGPDDDFDTDTVQEFESRFDQILDTAKEEYEYEPPTKYYKDGYNLSVRLREYRDACLLFLHDKRVPADNNLVERLLRIIKRKMKQVMTFRSFDSIDYLCQSMTMLALLNMQSENFYKSVADVFA